MRLDNTVATATPIVDRSTRPVGLSTLGRFGEERTPSRLYEPYLLQLGFIQRTPRGRIVTEGGRAHLGIAADQAKRAASLF